MKDLQEVFCQIIGPLCQSQFIILHRAWLYSSHLYDNILVAMKCSCISFFWVRLFRFNLSVSPLMRCHCGLWLNFDGCRRHRLKTMSVIYTDSKPHARILRIPFRELHISHRYFLPCCISCWRRIKYGWSLVWIIIPCPLGQSWRFGVKS